jgi:hypothetical protein
MFAPAASLAAALALAFLLSGCGSTSPKSGSKKDTRIVLDRSIGGVALRGRRAEVERRLGRGSVLKAQDQKPPEPRLHIEDVLYATALKSCTSRTARLTLLANVAVSLSC